MCDGLGGGEDFDGSQRAFPCEEDIFILGGKRVMNNAVGDDGGEIDFVELVSAASFLESVEVEQVIDETGHPPGGFYDLSTAGLDLDGVDEKPFGDERGMTKNGLERTAKIVGDDLEDVGFFLVEKGELVIGLGESVEGSLHSGKGSFAPIFDHETQNAGKKGEANVADGGDEGVPALRVKVGNRLPGEIILGEKNRGEKRNDQPDETGASVIEHERGDGNGGQPAYGVAVYTAFGEGQAHEAEDEDGGDEITGDGEIFKSTEPDAEQADGAGEDDACAPVMFEHGVEAGENEAENTTDEAEINDQTGVMPRVGIFLAFLGNERLGPIQELGDGVVHSERTLRQRGDFRVRKRPGSPFLKIFVAGKQDVMRVGRSPEPANKGDKVGLGEDGASGAGAGRAAANVKKNGTAGARDDGIGVMPNLHPPTVGGVAVTHFLFFKPGRWCSGVDCDKAIVKGKTGIVGPGVVAGDGVERKIRSGGKGGVGGVDFADFKNAGGSAFVAFHFFEAGLFLASEAAAPGQTVFTIKRGVNRRGGLPLAVFALKKLQGPALAVPSGSDADNELLDVLQRRGAEGEVASQGEKKETKQAAKHFL